MRLRHQYLVVGALWALILGLCACLLLVGFSAGVSWLWIFGDDPWPEATRWVLPLIGVIGGILVALTCMVVAKSYGRKREALPRTTSRGDQRKVFALLITPLVLLLLVGLYGWTKSREYAEAVKAAAQREAVFAAIVGARHRVAGIAVDQGADHRFRAEVQLAGDREGDYRLSWRVVGTSFGAEVAAGDRQVWLQPGERRIGISFTLDELARSYRVRVLNSRGGVLVEEPFRLDVTLDPVLSETERGELPLGEQRRLDTGESPLRSQKSTRFPVRFIVRRDGSIEE